MLRRENLDQIETIKTKCISEEIKMHRAVAINYARSIAHLMRDGLLRDQSAATTFPAGPCHGRVSAR